MFIKRGEGQSLGRNLAVQTIVKKSHPGAACLQNNGGAELLVKEEIKFLF